MPRRRWRTCAQFNAHVIDSLVSGLVTADAEWRVLTFNRAAARHHRRGARARRSAVTRAQVLALAAGVRRAAGAGRRRRAGAGRTSRMPPADGRTIDLGRDRGAAARFPTARAGHLFTFQDVTDVKRLERDAGRRDRLAAVGEMAAGIAHEIRNPLASMSGSMQVLRAELSLNGEQAELMDIVLQGVGAAEPDDPVVPGLRAAHAADARPPAISARWCATRRGCCRTAPTCAPATASRWTCRRTRSGARPTRTRCGRFCGTWPPTACGRCPAGGRLRLSVRETPEAPATSRSWSQDAGLRHRCRPISTASSSRSTARSSAAPGLGLATVHRIVTELRGTIQVNSTVGAGHHDVRAPAAAGGGTSPSRELSVLQEAV